MEIIREEFLQQITELLINARKSAKTAVNLSMVYTYYEIGKRIFEEEQLGNHRAEYGTKLVENLAEYLTKRFGKGFSETNLRQMRKFYTVYSQEQIQQKPSAELPLTAENGSPKFCLSWSHYLKLMRIDNPEERRFYEIECKKTDGDYPS